METNKKITISAASIKRAETKSSTASEVLTVREYINNLLKEGWNYEETIKGIDKKKALHFYFVEDNNEIEHKYLNFKLEAAIKVKDFSKINKESKFLDWQVKTYIDHNGNIREYIAEAVIFERKQQELF